MERNNNHLHTHVPLDDDPRRTLQQDIALGLGQEMEDIRRKREVGQEIIPQHIGKHMHPYEALPSITGRATENGETHLPERYLKITVRVARDSEIRRRACKRDVSSMQGAAKNNGGWWL